MKHLLLVLLLCMGMINSSPAQQYFNVRNTLHSFSSVITGVVERDNKYYCSVAAIDSVNAFTILGNRFVVFDSVGNKVLDSLYQHPNRSVGAWSNSFQSLPDKGFLLVAESLDTVKYYAMIIRYDSVGKVVMSKEISKPFCTDREWYKAIDIAPAENYQWVMLSRISCKTQSGNLQADIVLTKLDSNFNIIWHNQYGDPSMNDAGWKLLVEPDGYLIAGGRNNIGQVQKNFTFRAMLLKTDTSGAIQWTWLSDPFKKTFEAKDVIRTQDGGYVYCGSGDGLEILSGNQTYSIPEFRGWVEKLDINRSTVWNKAFGEVYDQTMEFKRVMESPDGRILLFGHKFKVDTLSPNSANLHNRGWFLTLSANGDSLRERTYYHVNTCNDNNSFFDAEQTADGGFIMVGESTDKCMGADAPIQRGWIVKVDSNGCLGPSDPQCWPAAVPRSPIPHQVTVYPNPVKDAWHISNKEGRQLSIMISDITGRTVIQKETSSAHTEINISSYAPGLYLYKISGKEGIYLQGKLLKE